MAAFLRTALAFVFFMGCAQALAQEAKGPKMVLEEEVFDSREIMSGTVIQHAFRVSNVGDQTLEIKDVKPG